MQMGAPGDLLLVAVMVLGFVGFILPLPHGRAGWILALLYLNICQNDWRLWVTWSSISCASSSGWGPLKFPGKWVCAKSSLHLPPTAWKIFQVPSFDGHGRLARYPLLMGMAFNQILLKALLSILWNQNTS